VIFTFIQAGENGLLRSKEFDDILKGKWANDGLKQLMAFVWGVATSNYNAIDSILIMSSKSVSLGMPISLINALSLY
jgi:hypothetical protein